MKRLAVDLVILNERAPSYVQDLQARSRRWCARASRRARTRATSRAATSSSCAPTASRRRSATCSSRRARRAVEPARDARRAGRARAATRALPCSAARRPAPAKSTPAAAVPPPDARVLQRPRRLRGGRPRVRDGPRPGPVDAGAVDQRDRESGVRLPGLRVGLGLHLVGQQPREPAHRLVERSGQRSAGRERSTSGTRRPASCGGRRRCRSARRPRPTSSGTGRATRRFEHASHGIALELLQLVPLDDPVKISRLTLTNASGRPRRLSVTAYVEWVLGASRSASRAVRRHRDRRGRPARCSRATRGGASSARASRSPTSAGRRRRGPPTATEFLGRNGTPDHPAALAATAPLSGRVGRRPRSVRGAAGDARAARAEDAPRSCSSSARRRAPSEAQGADRPLPRRVTSAAVLRDGRASAGTTLLGTVQVRTPDRCHGHPAEPLAALPDAGLSRVGALGVLPGGRRLRVPRPAAGRDGARAWPSRSWRASTCCAPRRGSSSRATSSTGGIRPAAAASARGSPTTCSGCRTSSPATSRSPATARVLDEVVPFLEGPPLAAGQHESYFEPRVSDERGTLFEHCARALDRSLAVGAARPAADGTGDWNDGMNEVGAAGQGRERLARLVPSRGSRPNGRRWPTRARRVRARRAVARVTWRR